MNCNYCNPLKDSCKHTKAICTDYDGSVNEDSNIKDIECKSIEETTQDIYDQLGDLQTLTDIEAFLADTKCLPVAGTSIGDALEALRDYVCSLSTAAATSGEVTFDVSTIDLKCLEGECSTTIETFKALIQAIIDAICALEVTITETTENNNNAITDINTTLERLSLREIQIAERLQDEEWDVSEVERVPYVVGLATDGYKLINVTALISFDMEAEKNIYVLQNGAVVATLASTGLSGNQVVQTNLDPPLPIAHGDKFTISYDDSINIGITVTLSIKL